jgi:HlyD family secretion protein
MKKPFRLLLIPILLVLVVLVFHRPRTPVETAPVDRGPVTETLSVDGIFRSRHRHVISAFATGEVEEIRWKVGDPVHRGQILTRILWDLEPEPVRSPIRGVISRIWRESAGPVQRGEPLLEVLDPERLEVVAEVLTLEVPRLRPGLRAKVLWSGAPETLGARIRRVSQAGFVKVTALGVEEERTEVVLDLEALPRGHPLPSGHLFHTEIVIETARVEQALRVPLGATFRKGPEWSVFVVTGGRAKWTRIARGIDDGKRVEVLDGLQEGQKVILYPGDRIREGLPVKPMEGGQH